MDTEYFTFQHALRKDDQEMISFSERHLHQLQSRRTVREFSSKSVPRQVVENAILAAASSPSGANRQPYKFVVVESSETKQRLREAAEREEHLFYHQRASKEWLQALKPFRTNEVKPYLTIAPYLVAVFSEQYYLKEDGKKVVNYYPVESTGIATGALISALHLSGLSTLTHTPSPMRFLNEILQVPGNYKPFLLLVVGHAGEEATVPKLKRKSLQQLMEIR